MPTLDKFKLMYEYEQLENNGMVTIRVPQKLKEDFIQACGGGRGYSRVLREFIVEYIADRSQPKK